MDPLTISAASGLRARLESLEMLANNIANESTGGYKADREFYSLYTAPEAASSNPLPDTAPIIERPWTDFSQGQLRSTGNSLDFALSGKGFFGVAGPAGTLYTRDGSFQLSPAGVLVTAQGYPVRAAGGGSLTLASSSPVEASPDGTLRQDGQVAGQLEIVDFPQPAVLSKRGHSYFQLNDFNIKPAPAAGTEVSQGKVENSNVSSAETAVRLISVMRSFEMLQKAIGIAAEMNRRAVEEVARV